MRIFAVHLLNDYSGSPKVLMQLVRGWVQHGLDVTVVACSGRKGFLSDIPDAGYMNYWYRWSANPIFRLVNLTLSQLLLFVKLFFRLKAGDVVYVNTVLPFGASLAAWLRRCRIIYHIHETSMKPPLLKKFLFGLVRVTGGEVVCVSSYLAEAEFDGLNVHILPNAIEDSFVNDAAGFVREPRRRANVLMICSLKEYKGIHEYVALAKLCRDYSFQLVVNASPGEVAKFVRLASPGTNLIVHSQKTNLHPFYNCADVIVNLSRPSQWIETFGLTIIEGMAHSLPAIVPPVGGIAELVTDGVNGFHAESNDISAVAKRLKDILDPVNYDSMAKQSFELVRSFRESRFISKSIHILRLTTGKQFQPVEISREKRLY